MWPFSKVEPVKSLYEKRLDCFQKFSENIKLAQSTDHEYINVSAIEGKPHENAWKRLHLLQNEYKVLYEQCKDVMNPYPNSAF